MSRSFCYSALLKGGAGSTASIKILVYRPDEGVGLRACVLTRSGPELYTRYAESSQTKNQRQAVKGAARPAGPYPWRRHGWGDQRAGGGHSADEPETHRNGDVGTAERLMTVSVGQPLIRESLLADRVADHLTARLLDRTLRPGMRMPSTRALAEQYGVSRTIVREALRTLIAKGLLEARGSKGVYVCGPGLTTAAESMSLLLWLHHGGTPLPYQKVHEVRRILEVEIAALAAQRAGPADVALLEREVDRLRAAHEGGDHAEIVASDVAFHVALAAATHNELFVVLINTIRGVLLEIRAVGVGVPGSSANAVYNHAALLETVRAHDVTAAARAMREHMRDAERILRRGLELKAIARTGSDIPEQRSL